jgi:hypothetical protein
LSALRASAMKSGVPSVSWLAAHFDYDASVV